MTYQIFVKQEALRDLERWIDSSFTEPASAWIKTKVRLCTQPTSGWIVMNVPPDVWWSVRDELDDWTAFGTTGS